ncbi:squalene/phytoene synthase family protein [Pseudooceanicola nanhaiensis]|uniref:squalene/phytoene synthase family protein n=1 Tax=Pseudooceanicola nanhaiensis TaxID=375761 RepID=UPI001CD1DA1F|nr:squalene/phytoene synthase family protein [Pseudooceanicola nanhaiensis]MCA0920064.1 squalene/phytoene synthase family protein [Pseudooceanicola nanhaiensis]
MSELKPDPARGFSEDLTACAALVERGDAERFRVAMAAPVAARAVLFPLYAFNIEVSRAPWVTKEPMIAEMRLQWWRDALEEIASGGFVRRHEVVTPLALVLDAEGARLLDGLVAARRWDIESEPFTDGAAFTGYLDATSGHLTYVAARALGPVDEAVARDAGFALGLANWFRAIPDLEAAGKRPLPDGRAHAVRDLADTGLKRLKRARAGRAQVSPEARPALAGVGAAEAVLRQVRARPGDVAAGAIAERPFRERAGLAWRVATGRW